MNDERSFERTARAWLELGANQAPDRTVQAVLLAIETTPQERDLRIPWRFPRMNKFVAIGLGTAAVVLVLVVGAQLLGQPAPSGVGGAPSVEPSAMPSPSPTPSPSASPAASPPPLTQTFTSQMHGISVSYPEGWTAQAATQPWTGTGGPHFPDPFADLLIDPLNENLFLILGSQPIGSSTPDEWVAETMATDGCSATEPIAVDGATGQIGCYYTVAVTTAGRGYRIWLYTPTANEGFAFAPYDRAWFEEVLATVQLQPEDALDVAPSATP